MMAVISSDKNEMNNALQSTIILDGSIPPGEIERMIENSSLLVVANMTKRA